MRLARGKFILNGGTYSTNWITSSLYRLCQLFSVIAYRIKNCKRTLHIKRTTKWLTNWRERKNNNRWFTINYMHRLGEFLHFFFRPRPRRELICRPYRVIFGDSSIIMVDYSKLADSANTIGVCKINISFCCRLLIVFSNV